MSQWLNTEPGKKQLPPYGWQQTKFERIKAEPAKEVLARPAVRFATRCVVWLSRVIRWVTVRTEKVAEWLNNLQNKSANN